MERARRQPRKWVWEWTREEDQEEMDEGHVTALGGVAIPLHPPSLVHWLQLKLWGKQVRKREMGERESEIMLRKLFRYLSSK